MHQQLLNTKNEALALINEAKDLKEIEGLRIAFLGRKGKINELLKQLPKIGKRERKKIGILANEVKETVEEAIKRKQSAVSNQQSAVKEFFDVTLPGKRPLQGHLHLVTQAIEEISDIFEKIGFTRVSYPEVEWDFYAFEGLNMPKGHPARDEWETFFVDEPSHPKLGKMVLTPHTSSGQIREMLRVGKPPIRMLNIAKCYRRQYDMTHTSMFHQFEGLVVGKKIAISHLKGTLDHFATAWFGPQAKSRLRPFHFQFTEPSFEVDFSCVNCLGKGCQSCKSGWLEIGGAGMIHPNVLKAGRIDPKYTGFAFGWGVERLIMLRSHIPNMRIVYENDLRFLKQF